MKDVRFYHNPFDILRKNKNKKYSYLTSKKRTTNYTRVYLEIKDKRTMKEETMVKYTLMEKRIKIEKNKISCDLSIFVFD
jgi:hypothetical protein